MKMIIKIWNSPAFRTILMLIILLLCSLADKLFGQVFTGLGMSNKGAMIQLGAMINKTELKASYCFPLLKNTNAKILSLEAGQKFNLTNYDQDNYSVLPYLGYAYLRWEDFTNYDNDPSGKSAIVNVSEFKPVYGLQIGKDSHAGNVYLFGQYCKGFYYGIGLKCYFSKL